MSGRVRLPGIALAAALAIGASDAAAACRQALALGLDISGSVDSREYRLQIDGLAAALVDPNVIDAFLSMPDTPVRLLIFEWAGLGTQRVLLDWTEIDSADQLGSIAGGLRTMPRRPREVATALGKAMQYGGALLAEQPECWKRTLDISGDGQSNIGPRPRDLRGEPDLEGVIVNALIIGSDPESRYIEPGSQLPRLEVYFRTQVIRGPDAFVITADGFDDYERAMIRKLLREIDVLAVGLAD